MQKVLVVIPARGGSKGIPGKNTRFLNGKPLIWYALGVANTIANATVAVSTEDDTIASYCKAFPGNTTIVKRPAHLAEDHIPLDPVIKDAVEQMESQGERYETVVTIQPTSPLLTAHTLGEALAAFETAQIDSMIAVCEKAHLFWYTDEAGEVKQFYPERVNRQLLKPTYDETGAFVICKRDVLLATGERLVGTIQCYTIPERESTDIDSWQDWMIAEATLKRKKIALHVIGKANVGLGHVYRGLTIAEMLLEHEVLFLIGKDQDLGMQKIKDSNYPVYIYDNQAQFDELLSTIQPDIVINDILDTDYDFIKNIKDKGIRVVNFEDLGSGTACADMVINALYECSFQEERHVYGYTYECLRNEFYLYEKKERPADKIRTVLVTFGGTDPNNLTQTVLALISEHANYFKEQGIRFTVIVGPGYGDKENLAALAREIKAQQGIVVDVLPDVKFMSDYMYKADLIITSNGRTVYEVVALRTPVITISQNLREESHLFAKICKGIVNLGLHSELQASAIFNGIKRIVENPDYRQYLFEEVAKFSEGIKQGKYNVIATINKELAK